MGLDNPLNGDKKTGRDVSPSLPATRYPIRGASLETVATDVPLPARPVGEGANIAPREKP